MAYENPIGFEQITLSASSASALTQTPGARKADIQIEGGQVRWRPDGTAPTTTVGWLLQDGDQFSTADGQSLPNCKFIAVSDNPVLNVIYT
jgi:hypothetical protein